MLRAEQFRQQQQADFRRRELRRRQWLARWEISGKYHRWGGPADLLRWFTWIKPCVHYLQAEQLGPLIALSGAKHRKMLAAVDPAASYIFGHVDEYNAVDYRFQNFYPVPSRQRVSRVLDFGAGMGRQVNLWSQLHSGLVYVAVDAIEMSYCLQNFYFGFFDLPLQEYMDDPEKFAIGEAPAIYHLPTWRVDLLPEAFFDLVICVQVLPEINARLLRHMLGLFRRVLKPGGALYIRDHDLAWQPAHHADVNRLLSEMGFALEFRPYVADSHYALYNGHRFPPDVHGVPRLWRKADPSYPPNRPPGIAAASFQVARGRLAAVDRLCGGHIRRFYHHLRRRIRED
jgi:SAM-dependent methyltransferase